MNLPPALLALAATLACGSLAIAADAEITPADQVAATERAFAQTMADRDLAAFAGFVDPEAVFLGGAEPLRGKDAVVGAWSAYFEGAEAPFAWEPATVEVLPSGDLALSTGPVHTPDGAHVATFTSIWRQTADGAWRIVFDRGCEVCDPGQP